MMLAQKTSSLSHVMLYSLRVPSKIFNVHETSLQTSFKTCSKLLHSLKHEHEHHLFDNMPHLNVSSINRSMLNFLHQNLPFQALSLLKKHFHFHLLQNVDEVTLALSFKACNGEFNLGSQIHGFAVSTGFVSRIAVSNSLMKMYCKADKFKCALRVFESLSHPDIVSWNTILSGFDKSVDALNFACFMRLNGIVFDPVTYTTALSFCWDDDLGFLFGLQLHSLIVKCGFGCEVFIGNALVTMYSRLEELDDARRVFDEMPIRDLVSWNAMLSGYAQEGECYGLEAVLLFVNMVRQGMLLDHVSFTGAVSACGYMRNLELGKQIHGLAQKVGYGTHVAVCNVLISTYSKCDVVRDAKEVFWVMSNRNVVSWTTMISIDEDDAVSLFNAMRIDGVYPNDVTFIGLLHAITIRNMVTEGLMIHGLCIKSCFSSEKNVSNSLITMYAKFESIQESKKVFEELNYQGTISWNSLISGYAQNGLYKEAFLTFLSAIKEIKPNQYTFGSVLNTIAAAEDISLKHGQRCHSHLIKLGLSTDPFVAGALLDMYGKRGNINESQRVFNETPEKTQFSWTGMISAYARHGDYESVMGLYKEMERESCSPDSITFLSVLAACCRKGMVDVGHRIFDTMVKKHSIEPTPEHYSIMVDMLGRVGRLNEAEELMHRIPGGPGLSVLQSLLGSCRLHGNVEMAERVVDSLIQMDPASSGPYVLMANLYAAKGNWEKVAQVRKGMRGRGVKKEVGFSWVDVANVDSLHLHGFSSGDKSHPESETICRMADFLGLQMMFSKDSGVKEVGYSVHKPR
ncbi:pentatricopeptide repeat-containing protein At4g32430, mitochondrial-like isoform X2 [Cicer arietinum]|uniref:Pentatricopeptide repeat-containing protein At4g32430, mitochondrial-like isoform X2 n=1 Tax=Cicer arietinum TaxID=3827 RepID=A0A1S3E5P4_CICAR|nr:pentatricopeptide repeat-containing protein At4g32430, mitochondrial-like isoform X2 [Cicer arietinum]